MVNIQTIACSGTSSEIGQQHGEQAATQVHGSIAFYKQLFLKNCQLQWEEVKTLALEFVPIIQSKWPSYLEEMEGIAEGAKVELAEIVALNVRTEINFGRFSDGCTAMSWTTQNASYLAQNWDWMEEQKPNLVVAIIEPEGKPRIRMITEAGIIGKIGFNDAGVGVCLNAIRAKGMDQRYMPCHLALRQVLECKSRQEAVATLERYGVGSSCHMLIADADSSMGLEWSSVDVQKVRPNDRQQIFHSNHYIEQHDHGVTDTNWLPDSTYRLSRIEELSQALPDNPTKDQITGLFKDTQNGAASICRTQTDKTGSATLFNIVMELKSKTATVILGRPDQSDKIIGFA